MKPSFLKFGMEVHWVNSLYGIAFGGNCFIDEGVISDFVEIFDPQGI